MARAAEDPAFTVEPPRPAPGEPVKLSVARPSSQRGLETLPDADFVLMRGWTFNAGSLAPNATFTHHRGDDGWFEISVASAPRAGSAFVSASTGITNATYEALLDYRTTGRPSGVLLLFRESGYSPAKNGVNVSTWDTVVRLPPSAIPTQGLANWTPRFPDSSRVSMHIRLEVPQGESATVAATRASLRPAPRYAWDLDGDGNWDASGAVITAHFDEGRHVVRVLVVQPDGARASSAQTVDVVSRPLFASFSLSPPAARSFRPVVVTLDASRSFDPNARSVLENGNFVGGLHGWTASTSEIGMGNATTAVDVERGYSFASLSLKASRSGAAFLSQTAPVAPGRTYLFEADVRDDGGIASYVLLLRERNASATFDTPVARGPTHGEWQRVSTRWTPTMPDAGNVTVMLRVRMNASAHTEAVVDFADVSLTPLPRFQWFVDDAPLSRHEPIVEWTTDQPGPHRVRLMVSSGRLVANASAVFTLEVPEPTVEIRGPKAVRVGVNASWEAITNLPSVAENLLAPNGTIEWQQSFGGIGAAAALDVASDGTHQLRVRTERGGEGFIWTRAQTAGEEPLAFNVEHWTNAGVAALRILIRESLASGATRDTVVNLTPAEEWRRAGFLWKPSSSETAGIRVYVRVILNESSEGIVLLRNPTLTRARGVDWSAALGALNATGSVVRASFPEPHVATVRAAVTDDKGNSSSASLDVLVTEGDPFVAAGVSGGNVVGWDLGVAEEIQVVASDRAGGAWSARGPRVRVLDEAGGATAAYEIRWDNEVVSRLSVGSVMPRPAVSVELSRPVAKPFTRVGVTVSTPDPTVTGVDLVIHRTMGEDVVVPMVPQGTDGYHATFRPGLLEFGSTDRLSLRFARANGTTQVRDVAQLPVGLEDLGPKTFALGLTVLALGVSLIARRWSRGV